MGKALVYVGDVLVGVVAAHSLSPDQTIQFFTQSGKRLENVWEAIVDFIQADDKIERALMAAFIVLIGLGVNSAIRKKLAGRMRLGNVVAY